MDVLETDRKEQIIRHMLQGFVDDPPDSAYQDGFLDAVRVIAVEVFGIRNMVPTTTPRQVRPALSVIPGGKQQ